MRRPQLLVALVVAPVIVFATAAPAWALVFQTHPYRIPPTRECLIRHHAHLLPSKYTTRFPEIQWVVARHNSGMPFSSINMNFFSNPAQAANGAKAQARSYQHVFGRSAVWVRHHLRRRENVVISQSTRPLTAPQVATITGCLRR